MLDATITPFRLALGLGHASVPAGPLPRFVQRKTLTPPLTECWPKWMCACSAEPSRSLYASSHWMVYACLSILARKLPDAALDTAGTSW